MILIKKNFYHPYSQNYKYDYSTVFFNKEGDNWKVLDIGINYGENTKIIVKEMTELLTLDLVKKNLVTNHINI